MRPSCAPLDNLLSHADVILEPDSGGFGMLDFDRFDELLGIGIRATRDKLAETEALVALKSKPDTFSPERPVADRMDQ